MEAIATRSLVVLGLYSLSMCRGASVALHPSTRSSRVRATGQLEPDVSGEKGKSTRAIATGLPDLARSSKKNHQPKMVV